jgi:glycosyltransferase involved in cell wall biosynthesis
LKTLLLVANVDWFLISHRLCIAVAAKKQGWEVHVACEDTGRANEITREGIHFIDFVFSRSGTNFLSETATIRNFYQLYKSVRPDVVHHITLKPVIYGSFVARRLGIHGVLNAVSGLGYTFTESRKGPVQKVMVQFMKYGFNRDNLAFIFQNKDDLAELSNLGVVSAENMINTIKGSGVNLEHFKYAPAEHKDRVVILFPTRMLWDKGTAELREASELLFSSYKDKICFLLAGLADEDNKAGVPASYLREWEHGEYIKWIGYQKDMVAVYKRADIVVLPSYREGMPKTLIEACAMGKPIVTTNAIGCRECVDEGVNGFKVAVKDANALANALRKLIDNEQLRMVMGRASREKAEKEFDQRDVIAKHLMIYQSLFDG